MPSRPIRIVCLATALFVGLIAHGADHDPVGRFDHGLQARIGGQLPTSGDPLDSLDPGDPLREAWLEVTESTGAGWRVWIDARSGLPTLAVVSGIRWPGDDPDDLTTVADHFLRNHAAVLGPYGGRLTVDRSATVRRGPDGWQVRLAQTVDGIPVEGAHYDFHVSRGNLVAFGASRLAPVRISTTPALEPGDAWARVLDHIDAQPSDGVVPVSDPELVILPLDAAPQDGAAWRGTRGQGLTHRLVWRLRFQDADRGATWTGEVDAVDGEVVAFYHDTRFARVRGDVYPVSNDQSCGEDGCLAPDYPMPYVDWSENEGLAAYTSAFGKFDCQTPGAMVSTTLDGKHFRIDDQCGPIFEYATCNTDIDLGGSGGTNCDVAPGASPGNTNAARTSYYSLNAVNRKARFWISGNDWLDNTKVDCRTNVGSTCNALYQSGKIHMYQEGNGCANTGEIQGIVVHEWGHGLNFEDGGIEDQPSEAYSDIIAMLESRDSCLGRGFYLASTCDGFGDTCLTCTGARDMDWDARIDHTPATPSGFLTTYCDNGDGPCGKRNHCESYVPSEAFFDLATRDLPAMGVDVDSAWQLIDRLWYQSRPGSGGNAYNCSLPDSDSCSIGSWYHQLRVQDDDDGNLANGTPHAAAIFAAFDRHDIACGAASDAENQNTSSCPSLTAPVVTYTAYTDAVELGWDAVPGAASYRIYRNEVGCDRGQVPIAEVESTAADYRDDEVANGFDVYYRVQAVGANAACESPVSTCVQAAAVDLAGQVRFDRGLYACDAVIGLEVDDANHPSSTIEIQLRSDTESSPETVILTETSPGSTRFSGSIAATTAPVASDGLLSVADGDTITAEYVDLDDGEGGFDVLRLSYAAAACTGPPHVEIAVRDITGSTAAINWTASRPITGRVEWGPTPALGNVVSVDIPGASQRAVIGPFDECNRIYFRVISTDLAGNTTVADVDGAPFAFNAFTFLAFYTDGFETPSGWTLDGDWEIGTPQGLGTAPGDPTAASDGTRVLGQDLTGLGAAPGDYETNTNFSATSPVYDTSSAAGVELWFDRWLNHDNSGTSYVYAKDAGGLWHIAWSHSSNLSESSWSEQIIDVSPWAAGNPNFQVRFSQSTRFVRRAGWNVDRVRIRDTDLPQWGPCGGCGGAPTFAGAVAVTDDDPCAESSLTVSWIPAPAWGTGGPGTYAVYRDVAPDFMPSAGNRVASGVTGANWTDPAPPTGVPVYYIVRAENDETCATGPNNGGVLDPNIHRVVGTDGSGGTPPGGVGESLRLDAVGGSDVRLSWNVATGATSYEVSRSSSPAGGFAVIGTPTGTSFDDPGALSDGQTWYYLVSPAGECN